MFIESFEEFDERQACERMYLRGRWLYANGAQSDGELVHRDPPEEPPQLRSLRLEFVTAKLDAKLADYDTNREGIAEQARFFGMGVGPHPDEQFPGWREGLETLRAEIENLQAQVRELEPRRDRSRQYDENRARQRSAAHDVISEIAQMPSFNR